MANPYYRRSGEILRDDGQETWSIYSPKLRGWERTKRANEAYATAFQDRSTKSAENKPSERPQHYDQWREKYKRDNPEGYRRDYPND